MQRLKIIENKVATIELIENLDKKIHNQITQYGSKVGVTLNFFKEKEPIVNERIDQDSTRIDKLEDIYQFRVCLFCCKKHFESSYYQNCQIYVCS